MWLALVIMIPASGVVARPEPATMPPTIADLKAVHIEGTAEVKVVVSGNRGKQAFAIFQCKSRSRVCYLFRSDEIMDEMCSSAQKQPGELELLTKKQVLEFFILRFKGIANDLAHQKWRTDVMPAPIGPDDEKRIGLYSIIYSGYASAMEEALTWPEPD
jgi:hypothetical protein